MGRRSRDRRAENGSAGRSATASGGSSFFAPTRPAPAAASAPRRPDPVQQVPALLNEAGRALHYQQHDLAARCVAMLAAESDPAWRRTLDRELLARLKRILAAVWQIGWQPVDLLRVAGRQLPGEHARLLRSAIAAELAEYAPSTLDPRWHAQLAEAEVRVWWAAEEIATQAYRRTHRDGDESFVSAALEVLEWMTTLPRIEILGPVPGTARPEPGRATAADPASPGASADPRPPADERILERVRALLAKAESTTFPAEAETFTAGAQALMARYSIDHALLAASGRGPAENAAGRRIGIDNPYEAPKTILLDAVAAANRCRAVWSKSLGFATIVGFPTDLDLVEMLFTSLLVQATAAMTREGARTDAHGRSRTREFRRSFLIAYADRIRERLTEAAAEQTTAAVAEPGGANLLPVLASRAVEVEQTMSEMFPALRSSSMTSPGDAEGWSVGRAAADRASLQAATPVHG